MLLLRAFVIGLVVVLMSHFATAREMPMATVLEEACQGKGESGRDLEYVACFSYIQGAIEYHNAISWAHQKQKTMFCVPDNVSAREIGLEIPEQFKKHPELRKLIAAEALNAILRALYPCETSDRPS